MLETVACKKADTLFRPHILGVHTRQVYHGYFREPHWKLIGLPHYSDVIMGAMASHITSLAIIYSTVYSGADQISASLAFVREFTGDRWIPRTKGQWRGICFPFDDVIMGNIQVNLTALSALVRIRPMLFPAGRFWQPVFPAISSNQCPGPNRDRYLPSFGPRRALWWHHSTGHEDILDKEPTLRWIWPW